MLHDKFDGAASANHQRAGLVNIGEYLLRKGDRSERDRDRVLSDRGFGAHLFRGGEHIFKYAVQFAANRCGFLRHRVGRFDLTENLRFAQHHRIESAGHPHHVTHGGFVSMTVNGGFELAHRQAMEIGQPLQQFGCLFGFMGGINRIRRQFRHTKELRPVASRQDGYFSHAGPRTSLVQGLVHYFGHKGDLFTHGDGSRVVIDAQHQ